MAGDENAYEVRLARLEEQFRAEQKAAGEKIVALENRISSLEKKGWGVLAMVATYVVTKILNGLQINGLGP